MSRAKKPADQPNAESPIIGAFEYDGAIIAVRADGATYEYVFDEWQLVAVVPGSPLDHERQADVARHQMGFTPWTGPRGRQERAS